MSSAPKLHAAMASKRELLRAGAGWQWPPQHLCAPVSVGQALETDSEEEPPVSPEGAPAPPLLLLVS